MFNALILPRWGNPLMATSNMHTDAQPVHRHPAPAGLAAMASSPLTAVNRDGEADTLNSKEIAGLVQKSLSFVKARIERLARQGVIELPPMAVIPTTTKPAKVYVFAGERGARDSLIVLAQLSPKFTACLIDHGQKQEAASSPRNALRMLQIAPRRGSVAAQGRLS